ncbi:hypothetical protein JQC79_10480 [Ochrobactrum anthropi]|uniref:hypothetical protein n=1 Tax=Brucella anthropi TaxID=529 RepID=UPI0019526B18|nr:hypothetical protein [Brucella anthropi]MBM6396175.1 hypothetical protein [Brucella anthropi]
MNAVAEAVSLAEETLTGDVRDVLLTHVRSMEDPWSKLSEQKQQDKIYAIERCAEDVVRRAVSIIAKRGFDVLPIKVADFTVKGGEIKGKFGALVSEQNVVSLSDHQGQSALIVLTDATDFFGERTEAKPDPDEPGLPIEDSDDGNVGDVEDGPELEDQEFPGDEE